MKSKRIITILLSLAIMLTFMPAMAFAVTYPQYTYTGVTWSADFHTVTVELKEDESASQSKSLTQDFGYMDPMGVGATKAEYRAYTDTNPEIKYFVDATATNGLVTTYSLCAGICKEIPSSGLTPAEKALVKAGYDYEWVSGASVVSGDTLTIGGKEYKPAKDALKNQLSKEVYDASRMAITGTNIAEGKAAVDAGAYSAWYDSKGTADETTNPAAITAVGTWNAQKGSPDLAYFTITYPEYHAYEFDTKDSKNVDKELNVTVTLNASAIQADYGNVNVSTAVGGIKLIPQVGTPNEPYYTGFFIVDNKPFNREDPTTYDNEFVYDGQSHNIVFPHSANAVTLKYFVAKGTKKTDGTISYDAPKSLSEYADIFPGIKDAGYYRVYVAMTAQKNNVTYYFNTGDTGRKDVVVLRMPVKIQRVQSVYEAEYGKFSETELEAALKALFKAPTVPDSQDKVDEVISKYLKVTGLFTQAGEGTVNAVLNDTDYRADTELAKAVANYEFVGSNPETNPGINLVIEKADNDLTIKTSAKTVKGVNKKTKKLKKNKSFKIKYDVQKGTVKFTKVSGKGKITVSKAGKVTVKKGLKKGTYKLKVKAIAAGNANYKQATATKTIKITVK